jgi:hypothetical protein
MYFTKAKLYNYILYQLLINVFIMNNIFFFF